MFARQRRMDYQVGSSHLGVCKVMHWETAAAVLQAQKEYEGK